MIKPQVTPLVRPVFEIAGLPAGTTLATVDGQLVERTSRLANGNLLIELPLAIQRPVTLNVNVK
jgi:hypothetical protein